jgi:hypothetical protein
MKKEKVTHMILMYIRFFGELKMRLTGERKQKLEANLRHYQNNYS